MMLDTICNVFGGVVLMCVLVVIQTQAAVQGLTADDQAVREASLTAREMALQTETDAADLEILLQQRQMLENSCDRNIASTTNDLLDRRQEFLAGIAAAELLLDDLQARQGDLESQLSEADADFEDAQALLEQAQQDSDEQADTSGQEVPPAHQLRLPVSHQSRAARQLAYVVAGGRVYPAWEPEHCQHIDVGRGGTEWRPVSGAGLAVSGDDPNAGFVETLAEGTARTHYVTFFVEATDQSFEAVQVLRKFVGDAGYDFGYAVYSPDNPLVVYDGKPDVQ